MADPAVIVAAGAIVVRKGPEVLLVHRPKYDDWSFPKGKVDPGEHVTTAAIREVAEETGLDISLGPPLPRQRYTIRTGETKEVYYWVGRALAGDDISRYRVNDEIDDLEWVPLEQAHGRLSYDRDREVLVAFEAVRKRTYPLVVLRHAKALARKNFDGTDDRERPLHKQGQLQADQGVPILSAFGVRRLLSSDSRRCWKTVSPYADVAELEIEVTRRLSEEHATPDAVARLVHRLLDTKRAAVLCTHRPVLPLVFEALGVEEQFLEPGAMFIAHHRRSRILATEHHDPTELF